MNRARVLPYTDMSSEKKFMCWLLDSNLFSRVTYVRFKVLTSITCSKSSWHAKLLRKLRTKLYFWSLVTYNTQWTFMQCIQCTLYAYVNIQYIISVIHLLIEYRLLIFKIHFFQLSTGLEYGEYFYIKISWTCLVWIMERSSFILGHIFSF